MTAQVCAIPGCGRPVRATFGARFCSKSCGGKAQFQGLSNPAVTFECPVCAKTFVSSRVTKASYCSRACTNRSRCALSRADVARVIECDLRGDSVPTIAKAFGVSKGVIEKIIWSPRPRKGGSNANLGK